MWRPRGGEYAANAHESSAPSLAAAGADELQQLVQRIAERIGRSFERSGLITRDIEHTYLAFDPGEEPPLHGLMGHSITYRIATGPREGEKVFTLQTVAPSPDEPRQDVAESSGFSLHAGIAAQASQREKLTYEVGSFLPFGLDVKRFLSRLMDTFSVMTT